MSSVTALVERSNACSQQDNDFRTLLNVCMKKYKENVNMATATELGTVLGWLITGPSIYEIVSGGNHQSIQCFLLPDRVTVIPSDCFPATLTLVFRNNENATVCETNNREGGDILFGYRSILDKRPVSILYFTRSAFMPPAFAGYNIKDWLVVTCYTGIIFSNLIYDLNTQLLYYIRPSNGSLIKIKIDVQDNFDFYNSYTKADGEILLEPTREPNRQEGASFWWSPARFFLMQLGMQEKRFTDSDVVLARERWQKYYNVIPDGRYNVVDSLGKSIAGNDFLAQALNLLDRGVDNSGIPLMATNALLECDNGNRKLTLDSEGVGMSSIIHSVYGNPFITHQMVKYAVTHDTI